MQFRDTKTKGKCTFERDYVFHLEVENLISLVILSQVNLHNLRNFLFPLIWAEGSLENTTECIHTACTFNKTIINTTDLQKLRMSFRDIDLERPTSFTEAYLQPYQTSKIECFV